MVLSFFVFSQMVNALNTNGLTENFTPPSSIKPEQEFFTIHFRQDRTVVDSSYLDNNREIAKLRNFLSTNPRIDSIVVYSFASPEGIYEHNLKLSTRRGQTVRSLIQGMSNISDSVFVIRALGENWPGFYEEVRVNYHGSDREQVLSILGNNNIKDDTKKWRLSRLSGGATYNELIRKHMPRLRMASWIYVYETRLLPGEESFDIVLEEEVPYIDIQPIVLKPTIIQPKPLYEKVTIAALKTNLLYDAVTVFNAELEVPIGERFSIMVEDVFPWWTWGPNKKKFALQMWEMGVEPRWWFAPTHRRGGTNLSSAPSSKSQTHSRDRLTGHFIGLYAMSAAYDFQNNFDICYQGEYWSAGLTYGFSMPIGKVLNMEFSASLGFLRSAYRHYQPDPSYEHLYEDIFNVGKFSYFGPTKLKVSLVLPITIRRIAR